MLQCKIIKEQQKLKFAWPQVIDLSPSMETYPNAGGFIHFPTNEKKYNELVLAGQAYGVEELAAKMPELQGRYVLSVGAELGFYYGAEFNMAGVINVDLNPAVSHLWFPFILYLSENTTDQQERTKLIEEMFNYVKAYRICQAPVKSRTDFLKEATNYHPELDDSRAVKIEQKYQTYLLERAKVKQKFQESMEQKPEKIKRFLSEYCPPEKKAYLPILNNPTLPNGQGFSHSPLFSRPEVWPFVKKLAQAEQLWLIRGSIIEEKTAALIKQKLEPEKIGLLYLSNVLQVLEPTEKKELAAILKALNLTAQTSVICSTINKNYLYSLADFLQIIE